MLEYEQQAAALSQSSESIDKFEELLEQKQKEYLEKQRHYEDVLQETVCYLFGCLFLLHLICNSHYNDFKTCFQLYYSIFLDFIFKFKSTYKVFYLLLLICCNHSYVYTY